VSFSCNAFSSLSLHDDHCHAFIIVGVIDVTPVIVLVRDIVVTQLLSVPPTGESHRCRRPCSTAIIYQSVAKTLRGGRSMMAARTQSDPHAGKLRGDDRALRLYA
jgi:hypothetical protein